MNVERRNCLYFADVTFSYEGMPPLFEHLEFGINMESRGERVRERVSLISPPSLPLPLSVCLSSGYCWSKWSGQVNTAEHSPGETYSGTYPIPHSRFLILHTTTPVQLIYHNMLHELPCVCRERSLAVLVARNKPWNRQSSISMQQLHESCAQLIPNIHTWHKSFESCVQSCTIYIVAAPYHSLYLLNL